MMALGQLILILCAQNIFADLNSLPVFILDHDAAMYDYKFETNPLKRMNSADFGKLVHGAIKASNLILIFVEDKLCMEDVSTRDKLGTPFYHLRKNLLEKKVKFLPAVSEPYNLLNQMFQPHSLNVFSIDNQEPKKIMFDKQNKYYYIFFKDFVNVTRKEMLRKHDDIINKVYLRARESSSAVVGFYTGTFNPIVVEKVNFVSVKPLESPKVTGVTVRTRRAMFRFVDVHAASITRRSTFNQKPILTGEMLVNMKKLSTKMAYTDFELQFNFTFESKGWILENVALLEGGEEVGVKTMRVGAPWFCSYVCAEPLVIDNNRDGSQVVISQYQIQPLYKKAKRSTREGEAESADDEKKEEGNEDEKKEEENDDEKNLKGDKEEAKDETEADKGKDVNGDKDTDATFGKSVNCGPYFSVGILSCLLVVGICLAILFSGIAVMFSCNGNDRFDEQNSKLNIGAVDG